MSANTKIEWCDKTWNPTRGCSRVSEGCRNCYAETFAARNLPGMRSPTTGEPYAVRTPEGPRWRKDAAGQPVVELIQDALQEPMHWKKGQRIFVNSMSDLFHEQLGMERDFDPVMLTMAACERHTFQILTKRPRKMRDTLDNWYRRCYPHGKALPNVWLGVSVEDQATADERIPLLLQAPAAVRFVSYEPGLAGINFERWLGCFHAGYEGRDDEADHSECEPTLDWVIVGGESGPGARPFDVEWARSTVRQCKAAGVPVFVKQLGAEPFDIYQPSVADIRDRKGGDPSEWPKDLRVREFPA